MFKRSVIGIMAACLLLVSGSLLSGFVSNPNSKSTSASIQAPAFEDQILQEINNYRQSKNLPLLEMNAVVSREARKHSADMASGKSAFGHDGFDDRVGVINKQIAGSRKFAENVAYGHLSAREVVGIWLNSAGHRHNIEGPTFNLTGIGTSTRDDGTIFFTQLFVAR